MNRKILVVDDERAFAEALTRRLALRGYAARSAGTAADALAAARRETPDVVLLDLRLPGGSPPELVAALRREAPGARLVLLSGQAAEGPGLESLPCLLKPVALEELLAAIEAPALPGPPPEAP